MKTDDDMIEFLVTAVYYIFVIFEIILITSCTWVEKTIGSDRWKDLYL